eukprot:SAG22_NODE_13394_length_408_cov_0.957929_2_plen_31_part_01
MTLTLELIDVSSGTRSVPPHSRLKIRADLL